MDNQVTFEEISLLPLLEKVLILVLMDNQVTKTNGPRCQKTLGLNPCFNG